MCYSAIVEQRIKEYFRLFGAVVDLEAYGRIFKRRVEDPSIAIPKALELNFLEPANALERTIQESIVEYQRIAQADLEKKLAKERERLATVQKKLETKFTKTAEKEKGVAERQIERFQERLERVHRKKPIAEDSRIWPFYYAPVILEEGGKLVTRPMRYHCRMEGKRASTDFQFPGLFNARDTSLEEYWKPIFGKKHALMVIESFFESVELHRYEQRELKEGEAVRKIELNYVPEDRKAMLVACLYDHWTHEAGKPAQIGQDFWSFAGITTDPPPEVAATGHDRILVALTLDAAQTWLRKSESLAPHDLKALLSERTRPIYRSSLAA